MPHLNINGFFFKLLRKKNLYLILCDIFLLTSLNLTRTLRNIKSVFGKYKKINDYFDEGFSLDFVGKSIFSADILNWCVGKVMERVVYEHVNNN